MPDEIELKLDVTPEAADLLEASGLLGDHADAVDFETLYFDTADHRLRRAGLSLRIRRAGDRRVQTVKGGQAAGGGLFVRPEWERPVDDDRPVIDDRTPIPLLLKEGLNDVVAAFALSVERRSWTLATPDGRVSLVIDRGLIRAGDRTAPISEIELELEAGDPAQLFALARRIDGIIPVRLGMLGKSEQGYRLLDAQRPAHKADAVALDTGMNTAAAFQAIARSCLRHYRLNKAILLQRPEPEALHQARVALRRLRSAFAIAAKGLDDAEADALARRVRTLANQLGEARDLDVLIARAPPGPVRDRLVAARESAQPAVDAALAAAESRALMLDLTEWLATGAWLQAPGPEAWRETPARDWAAATLARLRRKVKRRGRKLAAIDDEARHDLRKDVKKLRYAADFFAPLFDGRKERRRMKRFLSALEDLQDGLGTLNDLSTAPRLFERLGIAGVPEAESLIERADKETLLERAAEAHQALIDAKRYWQD